MDLEDQVLDGDGYWNNSVLCLKLLYVKNDKFIVKWQEVWFSQNLRRRRKERNSCNRGVLEPTHTGAQMPVVCIFL